jgi:3-isopropylmalate dehydrogenase
MNLNIAVLPGDGIGPEVIEQAIGVLNAVGKKYNHHFNYSYGLVGAAAIDKTGHPYPEETHKLCLENDAILFGAIGDPKYDNDPNAKVRPEQGLLSMRKKLGLYANIRPTFTFKSLIDKSPLKSHIVEGTDFITVRELTGGIYFGEPRGRSEDGQKAFDTCVYTVEEIKRIAKVAFELAGKRKKKVSAVDKANILATSRLWRSTIQQMSKDYPDIELEFLYVDAASMRIIQWPRGFDVIVTENLFGDILTDEASVITGSLGMAPSASVGIHTSLYEPIHGSYPQATGKNIANPCGTILSASMMLESSFNLKTESTAVYSAVEASIEAGIVTEDLTAKEKAYKTSDVGSWIAEYILR